MKKFQLINKFLGYSNKSDITNTDPRFMVSPSQNVFINDQDKVQTRPGYELDGTASTDANRIVSSYDWNTSTGVERNIRTYDDEIEYRYVASDGTVTWRKLDDGFTTNFYHQFAEWWSTTEAEDLLIIASGDSTLRAWSGAITTFASATSNSITKEGSSTWAEERFLQNGTRKVIIDGTEYTYTGGEGTTTLTGVTPDPTAAGHSAGEVVHQALVETANKPAAAFDNDIIAVLNNQIWVGDLERRDVYVSKNTDYTDFAFTTPTRAPGEGALLTFDTTPVAFAVGENAMYISGTKDNWYQSVFTLSADLSAETLTIDRLKSGPGQGAKHQASVGQIKNAIIYINNENSVDSLGRVENVDTPQAKPLSDIVKNEFDGYDYTIPAHIKYFKNKTYMAIPSEGKVIVYDHEKGLWNPPWIMPISRLAIIDGDLYGHSSNNSESFKLLTGTNDNGNPFTARAAFAYRSFGRRDWKKIFSEWMTEGYISSNTTLTVGLKYDFGGFTSIIENSIDGSDSQFIFSTITDNSLGKVPIGSQPIGSITDSVSDLPKFRIFHEITETALDFYEIQPVYESNEEDAQWELLAFGPNARKSKNDNIDIKG